MAAHPRFPAVPDCTVLVAHESRPDEAAAIRVRARAGELIRIAHGRYADTERWKGLRPEQRHHVLVRSLVDRIRPRFVVSHLSAAAVIGVPHVGRWPERVHLTRPGRDARTTNATFVVHADFDPSMAATWRFRTDDLTLTGFDRTAVDLAMTLPMTEAVVALDRLLALGADRDAVLDGVARRGRKGRRRALRSVGFADAAADSVGESLVRVRLDEYGAPTPVLQRRFTTPGEPDIVVDFWLPDQGVVIEFDGEVKYRDPGLRGGRSAEDIVIAEKYREDRLRSFPEVRGVIRYGWKDVWDEPAFRAKLRNARVPMSR
ncbi:hypothetical protein [Curtobacterium sp. BRB10]|uniref:hypothetical protein n=1 Tax=Curtobacterium sp. BRB10 TaxID=2962579 RepID=UPI002881F95D|nr:hypothetical protein [Curtobacterium sp. BRB10]MDT0233761.1 hypothetical protein [Curtobacterium sp. BRB10]